MSDLSCAKEERNGQPIRVYRYQLPSVWLPGTRNEMTAYVDDQTGLPMHLDIEGGTSRQKTKTTISIALDSTITIRHPPRNPGPDREHRECRSLQTEKSPGQASARASAMKC